MTKTKKIVKYLVVTALIVIYMYYFILNNFDYDLTQLIFGKPKIEFNNSADNACKPTTDSTLIK